MKKFSAGQLAREKFPLRLSVFRTFVFRVTWSCYMKMLMKHCLFYRVQPSTPDCQMEPNPREVE